VIINLHETLSSYIARGTAEQIRSEAAMAYTKFEKCSLTASKKILVAGY